MKARNAWKVSLRSLLSSAISLLSSVQYQTLYLLARFHLSLNEHIDSLILVVLSFAPLTARPASGLNKER